MKIEILDLLYSEKSWDLTCKTCGKIVNSSTDALNVKYNGDCVCTECGGDEFEGGEK